VYITFHVPNSVDFKSSIPKFYEISKKFKDGLLYYAYAENDRSLMVQEGFENANAYLKHFAQVNTEFDQLIDKVGKQNFNFMALGPVDELEVLKPRLQPLGCRFVEMDKDAVQLCPFPTACSQTNFTMIAEFSIPEGNMESAREGLPAVKEATKNGKAASGCYYHGFGQERSKLISRESYKDGSTFIQHVNDVRDVAKKVVTKFTFVGIKSDLDMIRGREYMKDKDVSYWELVDGAFWA